jgi:hypothetical protein
VADILRGPLYVNRRQAGWQPAVFVASSLLLTTLIATTLPQGAQATASAPSRKQLNANTSQGTPLTLLSAVPAPVVNAPQPTVPRKAWIPADTSAGMAKVLRPELVLPVGGGQTASAPPRPRLVVDTSASQPLVLQQAPPPPPFFNPQNFFAPKKPWIPPDTSRGIPKPLYADAAVPFKSTTQVNVPWRKRAVFDTSKGTPVALYFVPPAGGETSIAYAEG